MIRISVLCPTRGRPEMLKKSIASLLDNADDPDQVEILLAVDPDDESSYDDVLNIVGISAWPAPQRFGYQNLHRYYNELARQAYGEWLFIWNDDAIMKTSGWDTVVVNHAPALLFSPPEEAPHCNAFPIIPTIWARVLGHLSQGAYVDTWLQVICEQLGVQEKVPIEIAHHAPPDITWQQGRAITPFGGPELEPGMTRDTEKLREYLRGIQ